jgi:hypothetical protein
VVWHRTKSNIFSICFAYYVEWEHQFGSNVRMNEGQGSSRVNLVWYIVWNLQMPSKVKTYLWKALHGIVSGMVILADIHIKVHPHCPIFQLGLEDMKHLLFSCARVREVWDNLGLLHMIDEAPLPIDRSGLWCWSISYTNKISYIRFLWT